MTALAILCVLFGGTASASDTWDTWDTGGDTAESDTDSTSDSEDTSSTDWVSGSPATELAGDEGGFSCAVGPAGAPLLIALPLLALARRRDRQD